MSNKQTIDQMWLTLLKVQLHVEDLRKEHYKLERDEVAKTVMRTVVGHREHSLVDTIEQTSQILEGFSREFSKLKDSEIETRDAEIETQ